VNDLPLFMLAQSIAQEVRVTLDIRDAPASARGDSNTPADWTQ
jgi:hypothetical protein